MRIAHGPDQIALAGAHFIEGMKVEVRSNDRMPRRSGLLNRFS
ncbi:hypothetical protein PSYMO_36730, partial [Pseudomonas amygdali pv. mori str. 301020]